MTLLALVDAVIADKANPQPLVAATWADVLTALYTVGFTGRVYVDFANGQPKVVSLPQPLGVQIQN